MGVGLMTTWWFDFVVLVILCNLIFRLLGYSTLLMLFFIYFYIGTIWRLYSFFRIRTHGLARSYFLRYKSVPYSSRTSFGLSNLYITFHRELGPEWLCTIHLINLLVMLRQLSIIGSGRITGNK